MLTGALKRSFASRRVLAVALASLVFTPTIAFSQHYMAPSPDCGGAASYYGNAYGPACGPAYGPYGQGCGPYGQCQQGGFAGPMPMGCGGTDPPYGYDLMNDVGIAGQFEDQRGPHYFDARVEAVTLKRDETFGRDVDFTSLNVDGDIVLSSSQLEFDWETGFRAIGRYDIGPLSVVEFGYMGIFNYQSSASFTDPDPVDPNTGNLFSLFSEFGTNPLTVAIEGGPMPETERSIFQSIKLDSDLQSAEMSYRRYWVGYSPRISGTLLAGFRYTNLRETFVFSTAGEAAATNFTKTDNNLAGFQGGGDIWIGLGQGLRLGFEGKGGIYNNHYNVRNDIETDPFGTTPPSLSEMFREDKAAFIGELSADLVADILPSWSIRVGYELLFMNSLVLAGENFNTASPYGLPGQAPRIPFTVDDGELFFHGGHAGLEFIW